MDFNLSDSDSSLSLDHLQLSARPHRACLGTSCSTIGSVIQRYRDGSLSDAALGIKTSEEIVSAIRTLRDVTSADGTVDWERFWAQRPIVNFRIAITSRSLRRIVPEVRASGLGILHLRKACSGLEKVGCVTVGALLDLAHSGIGKLSNFGATAHVEVVEALLALSQAVLDDGIVDWLVYAGVRGFPLIPDVESEEIGGEAALGLLEGICKQIIPNQLDDRAWQIFRRRILLPEANRETLETIGSVYGLTRERIRQIESEAIDAIREPLFDENYSGLRFRFRPELRKAFDDARKHYVSVGLPAWPENRWLNELAKLWKVQMPAILRYDELLIELFGYRRINLDHAEMEQLVVRDSTSKVEAKRLASLVEGVHDVLSDESAGLDAFGLAAALKRRKLDLASLDEVPVLIELCSTAEGLGEGAYRLRFDALSGRTEQAYRVLSIHGSPMHHSDIFREINRQLPLRKRIREKRNLVNQLSADSRLQPIGKTGLWTLAEWGLDTRALVDVIEDVLTEADEPMPLEAISEQVLAKRPGSLVSVVMLLKGHPDRFRRAGARMYGLATWDQDSSVGEWWDGDEIAQFVKEFFSKRNGEPVDFRELRESYSRSTGLSARSAQGFLAFHPAVEVDRSDARRRIARFRPNWQTFERERGPRRRGRLLMDQIVELARKKLADAPSRELQLIDIVKAIEEEMGAQRPTIYASINQSDEIETVSVEGSVLKICRLPGNEHTAFPQLSKLLNPDWKAECARAIAKLTIDDVDIGLFILGRQFDQAMRQLLETARDCAEMPVTADHLKSLGKRVTWAIEHKMLRDEATLNLLRNERNARGHEPAPVEERRAIMRFAPFLATLYIDYLVLIEQKTHDLRSRKHQELGLASSVQ